MSKDNKELEESALHEELLKKAAAKEHEEKLERVREKLNNTLDIRDRKASEGVKKKLKDAKKYYQTVEEMKSGKSPSSNKNMEFGTFFSWVMNSAPEFEGIVKVICYNAHAKRKQIIGDPMSRMIIGKSAYGYHYLVESLGPNGDMQFPDIKYITDVDADGKLQLQLMQDSFDGLLNNPDGSYNQEAADEIQQIFQGYVHEWINTLDGVGPTGEGYFMAQIGNTPEYRIYSKEFGEQDPMTNTWKLKPGSENNFVKPEEYDDILNGCGSPEKSFSVYLQDKCHDVNLEPVAAPRMGM